MPFFRLPAQDFLGTDEQYEGAQSTATERAQPTVTEGAQPTATEGAQPTATDGAQPTAIERAQPTATEGAGTKTAISGQQINTNSINATAMVTVATV